MGNYFGVNHNYMKEKNNFLFGPMSTISECVKEGRTILVSCRNNRKLLGHVKAVDRHFNLILENVREMWQETNSNTQNMDGNQLITKERFISKLFVRGDTVILLLPDPY